MPPTAEPYPSGPNEMAPLVGYYYSVQQEFAATKDQVALFTPHKTSIGSFREHMLRSLLVRHCPNLLTVATGFAWKGQGHVSNQLDILVYDSNMLTPCFNQQGFVVVHADSVVAAIEVKSKLDKKGLAESLNNIRSVRKLNPNTFGAVFSYAGQRLSTTLRHVDNPIHEIISFGEAPAVICALPKATGTTGGFVLHSPTHASARAFDAASLKDEDVRDRFLRSYCCAVNTSSVSVAGTLRDVTLAYSLACIIGHLEVYCQQFYGRGPRYARLVNEMFAETTILPNEEMHLLRMPPLPDEEDDDADEIEEPAAGSGDHTT